MNLFMHLFLDLFMDLYATLKAACSIVSSFLLCLCSSPLWPGLGHHEPQGQGSFVEGQHSCI